jgi:hypothetical protein
MHQHRADRGSSLFQASVSQSLSCLAIVFAAGTLASLGAMAQAVPPVKPGLWEVTFKREIDGQMALSPNERVARLSGEERSKLQSMIRRGVIAGDHSAKVCILPDVLTTSRWHGGDTGCTIKYSEQSAHAWKWHSSCPAAQGDGQVLFDSPERYTQITTTTTTTEGVSHIVKVRSLMVWQGANCAGH